MDNSLSLPEMQSKIKNFFRISSWGSVLCIGGEVLNLLTIITENEDLAGIGWFLLLAGLLVWGVGMICAGTVLCNTGHKETGVRTAGGALIFWALAAFIYGMVSDGEPDFSDMSYYIWQLIILIGPGVFYVYLRREEDDEKFLDMAGFGIGMVATVELVMLAIWAVLYNIFNIDAFDDLQYWLEDNLRTILIILVSAQILGFVLAFGNMCNNKEFVEEIEESDMEEEDRRLMKKLLKEYKEKNEAED